jgi:hypothetical protein
VCAVAAASLLVHGFQVVGIEEASCAARLAPVRRQVSDCLKHLSFLQSRIAR